VGYNVFAAGKFSKICRQLIVSEFRNCHRLFRNYGYCSCLHTMEYHMDVDIKQERESWSAYGDEQWSLVSYSKMIRRIIC
jgi:hypothetical protein